MSAAIALEDVHFGYEVDSVLEGFDLAVAEGEVLALLGPSGCGKSTVLRLLLGLEVPLRGVVRLGQTVANQASRLVVPPERRRLAVVFQDLALWPHLTVQGNLSFGLAARGVPRGERHSRVTAILKRLGIADTSGRYPGSLSGGERQRVAIARALVLEPRAVLFDEPLSNLDVVLKRDLLTLFRTLLRERQTTAIYVTHDPREAAALGDRIAVMESGRVAQVGTVGELREEPASPFVRDLVQGLLC